MKAKLILLAAALLLSLPRVKSENVRSLTNTLEELRSELKTTCEQREKDRQLFTEDYDQQHQQMINVITESNELSLLLYTQEQARTFDMAYALKKVTAGYKDSNKNRRPYDQVINGLNFEIERYARLIEALRRLPPEMRDIEIVPDSLLYRNDSLDLHMAQASSSLEKEIIRIAVKDSTSAPFVLDESGEEYRDTCILYAFKLLQMYAGHRDSVIRDSTHYQEAYLRTKEAYDYAEARYAELDKYVFEDGQIPYLTILTNFNYYWNKMLRVWHNQYDYDELKRLQKSDDTFYNSLTGRAEKAYLITACAIQLGTLVLVWAVMFAILLMLCRWTKLKNYIPRKSMPMWAVLLGTVLYFMLFGYFWEGSEYIRAGVKNINTFLWLLTAISGSLLLRVDADKLRYGAHLYAPTFLLALVVIVFRNIFVPDIVMSIVFTPILLLVVLAQASVCAYAQGKAMRIDSILGWVSLAVYVLVFIVSFCGFTLAALHALVWWYFQLAALLTILCVWDLAEKYKAKKGENWLYDLVKQVAVPALLLLSFPWSMRFSLDIFDFTDLYNLYFHEPFFRMTDETTGVTSLRVSVLSIINIIILFFVLRYISRIVHALYQQVRYAMFMRKYKRTSIRDNEINLSLGNSIISVVIWMFYAVVIINAWNIPTGSLGLIAGGLSAGIGIALKDIINNFIYGIQLMGGRMRVGDWIECEGVRGKVTEINYQCVQVETEEGTEMSFLNSSLFGKNFNNLTRNNSYEFTKIIVGVAYGTDIQKVRNVLIEATQKLRTKDRYGREIVDPAKGVYIVVDNMSESSVDIAVKQYVLVAERIDYVDLAKEVIYKALNDAGISIPFPQCDVHLVKE